MRKEGRTKKNRKDQGKESEDVLSQIDDEI